jgi:dihydroorotate dehydrogenase electron transfer subunit
MTEEPTELIFNREVASDVFLMGLRSSSIVKTASAGQFVMIRVRDGIDPLLRRPFSVCGVLDDDIVLILYRIVGHGTSLMTELKAGQKLSVLGPLGCGFKLPKKEAIPVLIAGGMGIAPLFYLAQSLKRQDLKFMAGFSTSKEIVTGDFIGGIDLKMSISTDDGTEGHHGMVTDLLNEYLRIHYRTRDMVSLFACGPIPMLRAVTDIATQENLKCSVSMEAHMACGLGACQGCAVKASSMEKREYVHVCKDGPVFSVDEIDWESL